MMQSTLVVLLCLIIVNQVLHGSAKLLDPQCGLSPIQRRIVGGSTAELNSAPWMVFLHDQRVFICGGSLITKDFVLTAAHCVLPTPNRLLARLGEYDWTTEPDCYNRFVCAPPYRDYTVTKIYTHPRYTSIANHDIALLKLNQSVVFTETIRPICVLMHENPDEWYWYVDAVKEFTLSGWGATEMYSVSPRLQTVNLTQTERGICHDQHAPNVDHTHICAGNNYTYACTGDSGGPLVTTVYYDEREIHAQVGIVSSGSENCRGITVFTNVLSFTQWIAQTISYDERYMCSG
ncbi:chymotrypsin-like protease CTRL-1 [Drosophila biarmipes]|uniref:chymotrypsin-like protease CTRL-1 n=1 Tax=Drosophila biarmipes TaxID=125945 RepID=UPI0021CCC3AB|nr:chymotrypsin-like protease CTRL-1 [Drosophila biarmipes]